MFLKKTSNLERCKVEARSAHFVRYKSHLKKKTWLEALSHLTKGLLINIGGKNARAPKGCSNNDSSHTHTHTHSPSVCPHSFNNTLRCETQSSAAG